MSNRTNIAWTAGAVCLLGAVMARAAPITVNFEGVLTEAMDPASVVARGYDPSIAVGAPFSGSFTYDPATVVDNFPADVRIGEYRIGTSMTGQVGTVSFSASDLVINIHDDLTVGSGGPLDNILVGASDGHLGGKPLVIVGLRLGGPSSVLSSDSLPASFDLNDFPDFRSFSLTIPDPVEDSIDIARGTITVLSVVPEPDFLGAIAVAFAMLTRRR